MFLNGERDEVVVVEVLDERFRVAILASHSSRQPAL